MKEKGGKVKIIAEFVGKKYNIFDLVGFWFANLANMLLPSLPSWRIYKHVVFFYFWRNLFCSK